MNQARPDRAALRAGILCLALAGLWAWGPAASAARADAARDGTAAVAADSAAAPPAGAGSVIEARPGAGAPLDLDGCVARVLERNADLLAERERRRELDGQKDQALSTGLPTVDLTGTWNRGRDPSFALDETFSGGEDGGTGSAFLDSLFGGGGFLPAAGEIPAQTFWRASANLNWTINPVKILGAIGAANLGIERQDLAVVSREHEVVEQTVASYQQIILAAEQLAAVEAEIANQQELLDIMVLRFGLGQATALDTLQAAVAVANLEPQLRQARQQLGTAGARLNALMGLPPQSPVSIVNEQRIERGEVDRGRALELARDRPDLRQMEIMTKLLRRNRQAQKADMRPYLTVNGSYGYVGRRFDQLGEGDLDFWNASVAVNVPLFDGLLTRGLVRQTEATIRRNETELDGARRQVEVEVLDLLDGLEAARLDLTAAELNMERAEDLLSEMTMMLRLGKTDYLSVLEAQSGRAQARRNLIQARYDVLTRTASLKRALGFTPLMPLSGIEGLCGEETR